MNDHDIARLKTLLATPKKIAIIPHKNPDGDAMGSTLALRHYLIDKGHEATVIAPNKYPKFLSWLPGDDTVVIYEQHKAKAQEYLRQADVIFTLDFNHFSRTGQEMQSFLEQLKTTFVMIDHHEGPDNYATVMYSDITMSSTCEMVYHTIFALGDQAFITPKIGTCIYTGIMTDTGSFRYPSTTAATHRVVADLMSRGVKSAEIHQNVFDTNSYSRLQLLGVALKNLKILPELKTAYITISQQELNDHNFKKGDTEGFVNQGLSIEGVIFAVIFIENKEEGIIKMSFRSKGSFSVSEFARKHFNGGGHHNAAGGRSELTLTDTVTKFLSILSDYKNELSIS